MQLVAEIDGYLATADISETIREGFRIAIVGPPNAGKSTLMNLVSDRKVSIISEIPGTTRDLVGNRVTLGGFQISVTDTAGIRKESADVIERQGIELAKEEILKSHCQVVVLDITSLENGKLSPEGQQILDLSPNAIVFLNKADLVQNPYSEHGTVVSLTSAPEESLRII